MSKKEQANCLRRAAELSHCLIIKNYGISDKEFENLVNFNRTFLNQPEEIKLKVKHPYKKFLRGYDDHGKNESSAAFGVKTKDTVVHS